MSSFAITNDHFRLNNYVCFFRNGTFEIPNLDVLNGYIEKAKW